MALHLTRRQCLGILGSAALVPRVVNGAARELPAQGSQGGIAAGERDWRGAIMILATPFTAAKAVDYEDLAAEVEWIHESGVQAMVWPEVPSDYATLTPDELRRGMEVVAKAHKGKRTPLILGVQQDDTRRMVELAEFAEKLAPDAMIALPPKVGGSADAYREYYTALAGLTSRPIFIRTSPIIPKVPFTVELIQELAAKYPQLAYVREDSRDFQRIARFVAGKPTPLRRVLVGLRGRSWLYEMQLGTDGTMNGGAMYAEIYGKLWSLAEKKDWDGVRDLFSRLLLMLDVEDNIPGAGRYILKRRGIFKTTVTRRDDYTYSPAQIAHIEFSLKALSRHFIRKLPAAT
jgi:dihydrodipicolinate synthase/N-acetylneuraminate lyase